MSGVLTWEYNIHSDAGLCQLFRHCFRESDDASFRGAVVAHHCNANLLYAHTLIKALSWCVK